MLSKWLYYTLIAFDERVTFWLQRAWSLPCACVFAALCAIAYYGYTQVYGQIMQHTHKHKAVTGCVEAKKLLSCRRQSNYSTDFSEKKKMKIMNLYIFASNRKGCIVMWMQQSRIFVCLFVFSFPRRCHFVLNFFCFVFRCLSSFTQNRITSKSEEQVIH